VTALAGNVAIITGAGGGIGQAAVAQFAAAGACVLAVDRDAGHLAGLASSDQVVTLLGDVTDDSVCRAMVAQAVERWGALHVLFNVAGISGRRFGDGPVDQCTDAGWDTVLNVNLRSVFLSCRAAVPAMLASGGGSIINLASVLGMVGGGELFATHAYAASKAGIIGLTRAMATYYAAQHLRVNALCPGLIDTPMAARAISDAATHAHIAAMQPLLAGPGDAAHVASAAVFLASDAAKLITGAVLPVDGGWTAQ
jgi:NAD(P)-dependent dehydrogenase (short-subunit alcohol dehydrogenase family)